MNEDTDGATANHLTTNHANNTNERPDLTDSCVSCHSWLRNTTNFPISISGVGTFRFDDIQFAFDNAPITTSYTYNSANELVSTSQGGATMSFAHDAWGRMTPPTAAPAKSAGRQRLQRSEAARASKTRGSSSAAYAYRYGDKLQSVNSNFPGEGNVTYNYGGDGKRRERIASGVTTRYNWDLGWNVVSEENASGALTNTYIHDPSRPIGTILAEVAGTNPATGAYRYYFQDNVGSTRRLRDQNRASLGQYEYEPYGTNYAEIGPAIPHKFTGHNWDATAQIYYTPYRYYAPGLARWISRDPLGMMDGPNVFVYVQNGPIMRWDTLGNISGPGTDHGETGLWLGCGLFWGAIWTWRINRSGNFGLNEGYNHCVIGCRLNQRCGGAAASLAAYFWEVLQGLPHDAAQDIANTLSEVNSDPCKPKPTKTCEERCHARFGGNAPLPEPL